MKFSFFPFDGAHRFKIYTNVSCRNKREWIQIWLPHVEQSDLCLHCFEFVNLVRVCITLGDFRQT